MANVLIPSKQNILAASGGNPVLRELLESLVNTVQATQTVTNTTSKNVPPQVQADVSYLNGNYIVQITNPGASNPVSAIQQAQATQSATQATTLQPVTPIFHQIRCATSPRFGVNDNVQTFGGDTGSTQTYWTLTNLGSGNFYFQVRSSYDGVTFNQWRNANGGQSVTKFPSGVTTESQTNSSWAVFTLPGNQLLAVGEGYVPDQGTFTLPENLYSSAMHAVCSPNGYRDAGHTMDDAMCKVSVVTPADTSGTVGIPDYPILVEMRYGDHGTPQNLWSGDGNIFAIAFDPAGSNVTRYISADGNSQWTVCMMPGGALLAIGSGYGNHGDQIYVPPEMSWLNPADMVSICTPYGDFAAGLNAHGIWNCGLSSETIQMQYADRDDGSGQIWTGHAYWMAVAWTPSHLATSVTGGQWCVINMEGGHKIAFGGGSVAASTSFGMPAGFNSNQMLAIASPATFSGSGSNTCHGIAQCDCIGDFVQLVYSDGGANTWGGNAQWLAFAWV